MPNYHIPLFPSKLYHIFSRAVGSVKLFREDKNYRFFLRKLDEHLSPVCSLWAYCLIPNHFHLLVEVKEEDEIKNAFTHAKKSTPFDPEKVPEFIMERFSNFLNSYTKACNKRFNRKGALFMDYIRRVELDKDSQLSATIFYVHKNPVHHVLVSQIEDWKWSSFKTYLSDLPGKIKRNEGLEWFGGKHGFSDFHSQSIDIKGFDDV